ncbi:Predicted arabinose efflux permease, MFS family [Mesobacillus persicus]|uniref:Predicted arabinose efflux permease, MFS family n=1 Tax=Mesobacillus persicus TaxID=930146 RepID=A0A1H7VVN8_9BACI|nr:MFS transporter [Mesobacillus persicus]SEM12818.1 Predicted arabinose efflux permease, MFS family [Mesobacillus persicus]
MKKNLSVFREEKNYARFLSSVFISGVGDWFHSVAVFSLLLQLESTGMALGITMALRVLPHLLFGPFGGLLADRFSRKKILVSCDVIQALAALSLLLVSTADDIWLIYVSTFVLMSATAVQMPTRAASIPSLVKKENLLKANSMNSASVGLVMVIGSMLGGFVTAALEIDIAFVVNAITLLVSAFIMLSIKFPHSKSLELKEKLSLKRFNVLLPIIKDSRILQLVMIYYVLWAIGGGIMNLIPSVFAFDVYNLDNLGVGILYACFGLGQILGGFVSSYIEKWPSRAIAIGFLIEGIAYQFFSISPNIILGGLMLVLALAGVTVGNTFVNTIVMQYVPEKYLGRFFSLIFTSVNVILGTTMIISGALLAKLLPQQLAMLSGVLITIPAIIIGYNLWRIKIPQSQNNDTLKA